ncbi:MAG: hypothetical protein M0R51_17955 [Clostridia bacterium]|nr:hypothetical protein [Clostridia bacterium]
MFMKKLCLDSDMFSFNECHNVIILPGIVTKYKNKDFIKITENIFNKSYTARIKSVNYYRHCDIPNFKDWHMARVLKSKGYIDSLENDKALEKYSNKIMSYLQPQYTEKSVVTVITIALEFHQVGYEYVSKNMLGEKSE